MVRLTDCPDMTLDVYHGLKTTTQQQQQIIKYSTYLRPWCVNRVDLDQPLSDLIKVTSICISQVWRQNKGRPVNQEIISTVLITVLIT